MKNRAFTFASYNADSLPCDTFFLVRAVSAPDTRLELKQQQAWNERQLEVLRQSDDVWNFVSSKSFGLVMPRKVDLAVHEAKVAIGPSNGPRYVPELAQIREKLKIRSVSQEESSALLREGERLQLLSLGGKLRDDAPFEPRRSRRPSARPQGSSLGVLQSGKFRHGAGEIRPCTVRVDVPEGKVAVLHVEQWREGTHGDRHRPVGELLFVFPAQAQIDGK